MQLTVDYIVSRYLSILLIIKNSVLMMIETIYTLMTLYVFHEYGQYEVMHACAL